MTKKIRIITAICISILLISTATVLTEDSATESDGEMLPYDTEPIGSKPEGRGNGEDRNWSVFGYTFANSFNYPYPAPDTNDIIWEKNFDADLMASPSITDGKIYIGGSDYKLYCIEASTGEIVFSQPFPSSITTSPHVVGNMLYLGCGDGKLYAFNVSNRSVAWSFPTGDLIDSSPKVKDGSVYFGSFDGYFYAVDIASRQLKWKYFVGEDYLISSSPAIQDDVLIFTAYKEGSGKLLSLDTDGFSDGNDGNQTEKNRSAEAGDLLWEFKIDSRIRGSASIMDGRVYVGSDGGTLYSLDLIDGSPEWEAPTGDSIKACPTTVRQTNSVIFGSWDGYLYNVNASTGAQIWKAPVNGYVSAAATVAQGKVYVGNLDYYLYSFDLTGYGNQTTEKIFEIYLGEHMWSRSAPVIHKGILYLACMNGDVLNKGKILAVGRPDVKLYNILVDDRSPYEDEMVTVTAIVKNNGSTNCDMDVEFYYASLNNQIRILIDKRKVHTEAGMITDVKANWQTRSGTWKIWVKLTNTTPRDTDMRDNTNLIDWDFVVTPVRKPEWNFFMKDASHSSYANLPVETSRIEWEASPGGHLYQPVIAKGHLAVTSLEGSVIVLDQYEGEKVWQKDFDEPVLSSASIHNDKLFVPFGGFKVRCFDLRPPGDTKWTYDNADIENPVTPLMAKNGIVFPLSSSGMVNAVDEDDGSVLWSYDLETDLSEVPLLFGESIVIVDDNGTVFRLNIFTGLLEDRYETGKTNPLTPTFMNGKILIPFQDGEIERYDPVLNSSELFSDLGKRITTNLVKIGENGRKALGTKGSITVISSDGVTVKDIPLPNGDIGNLVGGPERCYFIDKDGVLYAVNTTREGSGAFLWNKSLSGASLSPPAVWQAKIYTTTREGRIYSIGAPNKSPVALIELPKEGGTYLSGDQIRFRSVSDDKDGDELIVKWISSVDGVIYEGPEASFERTLSPGDHLIMLEVDDQRGGRDTASIRITVLGKEKYRADHSRYGLSLYVCSMGEGNVTVEASDDIPDLNDSDNWTVLWIQSTHPWLGWMTLRFNLTQGTPPLPPYDVDLATLGLYLWNSSSSNWTEYEKAVLLPSERTLEANLSGENTYILSLYGQIGETPVEDLSDPLANAGEDIEAEVGATVTFDGSGSRDDIGIVNYTWKIDYLGERKLFGSRVSFTFRGAGTYEVTLNVTDAAGNWTLDSINVTIREKGDGDGSSQGDDLGTWVVLLVVIILILGIFIFSELKKRYTDRSAQKTMNDAFFRGKADDEEEKGDTDVKAPETEMD